MEQAKCHKILALIMLYLQKLLKSFTVIFVTIEDNDRYFRIQKLLIIIAAVNPGWNSTGHMFFDRSDHDKNWRE